LLLGAMISALGSQAEGCWLEHRSGYIKCGIFTVHLNSYVVLVVQCLGLGPCPLSPGMVYPRRPYRLWWVLTLRYTQWRWPMFIREMADVYTANRSISSAVEKNSSVFCTTL